MSIRPFLKLFRNDRLSTFISSSALLKPFFKLSLRTDHLDTTCDRLPALSPCDEKPVSLP